MSLEHTYHLPDMLNQYNAQAVIEGLFEIPKVDDVEADVPHHQVRVTILDAMTHRDVLRRLSEIGFPADDE